VVPINDKNGSKKVKINNNIEVKQEFSFYPKTGYTKNITITMNGENLEVVPIFGLWGGRVLLWPSRGCSALWPSRGRTHGLATGLSTRGPLTVQKYNNINVTLRIFLTLTI
jgi:hypothetical protein